MPGITAVLGDITEQNVDAIVNAANNAMRGGGGVDGAIHRAGGPAILQECVRRFPDGLVTGDAGWTAAGELSARWVIHTVGPNYHAGQRDRSVLSSCYRRALEVADELGVRSIAFPLISTGVYGWPRPDAIAVAVDTIAAADTGVAEVRLVAFDPAAQHQIVAQLALWTPLRILQGIRVLHRRGYHQIRVLPGMSPSGGYWRVAITTADNVVDGDFVRLGDAEGKIEYSTGAGTEFLGSDVTVATKPEAVADLIARALPKAVPTADDPAYAEWFAALMRLVEDGPKLPVAYAEYFDPSSGWEVGWGSNIRHPGPPPLGTATRRAPGRGPSG